MIFVIMYVCDQVLIRDQLDDNVIPVVEELRRRLNPVNYDNGEGYSRKEDDEELGEEEG